MQSLLADLAKIDHVTGVSDPYTQPGGISRSGQVALANLQLDEQSNDIDTSVGKQMIARGRAGTPPTGLQVHLGRPAHRAGRAPAAALQRAHRHPGRHHHPAHRLRVGAGHGACPSWRRCSASAVGLPLVELLTHVLSRCQPSPPILATMIGIGVGIDYALFVVTRYRQGLQAGPRPRGGGGHARSTPSGRAVLFAGLTVVIALVGMLAMGLSFISGLGIGAGRRGGRAPCWPRSPCCRPCSASWAPTSTG